ncbi:MAG TPA: RNA polymerase subunit sigma-70 [Frankiaceae bacterium]|nr:RNA polymerase subunit sigma-70 [Frankiaceae bacterium]
MPGDEAAFTQLAEGYRGELRVHCYRMLGSFTDAEDHVQETLLRAWRARATVAGSSTIRPWLYRIATNACLDTLRKHPERVVPVGAGGEPPPSEIPWLQPYPDRLLDSATPADEAPDALVVARETIGLAYLAAIQLLPPNQRAVLILRDVLDWSAAETADLLDTSVASVTSALQRARATMKRHRPDEPDEWAPQSEPSAEERELLQRYMDAHARADSAAVVALMREDVRFTMPPQPTLYEGRAALASFFADALGPGALGEFRLIATQANRQPAAANYVREPGEAEFRAVSLDVLRFAGGELVEITTFDPSLFPLFGLPAILRENEIPPTD